MNAAVQQQLTNLLRANSMTPDTLDGSTLTQLFLSQMRISLYGGVASIPMFPTFLPPFGTLTENKPIAVAELDDQEIRVSLVTFSHGEAHFSDQDRFPIPGREYPAPWEDLIYAIGELTQPLLDRAQGLALCLPFSVVYDGKGDGTISRFPGSMTIHGFSEKPVLASLREELQSRGCPIPPMTLINESDAVLLAAGVQNPGQGRYLGVTWGSSIDVGFVAPGSIVLRWPGIPGDLTLFTGGFSQAQCVPFGLVDYSKDRDCYAPGLDLYLKMVSTDYLGEIFRLVMIKAAERKLLSFGCSRDILSLTQLDLETVRQFMADPQAGGTLAHFCREPEDREVALVVAQAVLERAARLVCANLAAVIQFIGGGRDANAPVCLSLQEAPSLRLPSWPSLKHRSKPICETFWAFTSHSGRVTMPFLWGRPLPHSTAPDRSLLIVPIPSGGNKCHVYSACVIEQGFSE